MRWLLMMLFTDCGFGAEGPGATAMAEAYKVNTTLPTVDFHGEAPCAVRGIACTGVRCWHRQ